MIYHRIKSFRSSIAAAKFGFNWNLVNKKPVAFVKENFVLFSITTVYWAECRPILPAGGGTVSGTITTPLAGTAGGG